MAASPLRSDQRSVNVRQLASQFGLLAVCLLLMYGLAVLTASLPLRLLDPGWQLRFSHTLISNGFLALLGLALIHLAAYLDPSNSHLIQRRNTFASLALVAVLGFLLIIPLQGYAVWRAVSNASSQQTSQLREVTRRIAAAREAINRSTSTSDLQDRLQKLGVTPLGAEELAQPLPALRSSMLQKLERTEIRAADELRGLPPSGVWRIVQGSIRAVFAALVLVVGFAAFARGRDASMTLLQSWQAWLQLRRGHSRNGWMGLLRRSRRHKARAFRRSQWMKPATNPVSSRSGGEG